MEHMWVPVLVIGLPGTAGMIRRLRANLLDELNKQYVVTGRAKGLPPFRLLVNDPAFRDRPMILETPKEDDGADMDAVNLGVLRGLLRGTPPAEGKGAKKPA